MDSIIEPVAYIEEKNKLGSVLGLDTMKELLKRLGNPEESLAIVHIAGTNGKGSTMAFLEGILMKCGLKVGRYISPTIHTYLERFQINRTYMAEQDFANILTKVALAVETMEAEGLASPTAFEIETAVSFLYFVEEQVDLVLLETGMGGRLDATNVVTKPLAAIIASISMDHMKFLGDTIQKIAKEKAGILKEGCPCILDGSNREALGVLCEEAKRLSCPITVVEPEKVQIVETDIRHTVFEYKGEQYEIRLPGLFQMNNAALAIETAYILAGQFPITKELLKEGLLEATWPGRFEVLGTNPVMIRDGAHNIGAVIQLRKSLEMYFTNEPIIYIIGVLADKQVREMLEVMLPLATEVITVTPNHPQRAMDGNVLAEQIRKYGVTANYEESVAEAVRKAKQKAGTTGVVVAFGSLYYIGSVEYNERT